jgi:hypothetical protein
VLNREMDQRKLANNERQVKLHNLRFEHVIAAGRRGPVLPQGAVPEGLVTDGRTWRISKVDGETRR